MILTQSFPLPPVNRWEVLRYAGVRQEVPELSALLDSVCSEAEPVLCGKVCWTEYPLSFQNGYLDLGDIPIGSRDLMKNLEGCRRVILFGATIGLPLDRLIARYGRLSPARALMLQALGAERIEALCDLFCETIQLNAASSGYHPRPRFSPGYGDLPLTLQTDIFRILDCPRKIGLTLNGSLLMSPSKSVTALIGLAPTPCLAPSAGCAACPKTDCQYRRMP